MVRTKESMEEEIRKNKKRIASLEKELKVSRANEKSLEKKIQKLKDKNKMLEKQLREREKREKKLIVRIKKLEQENKDRKARKRYKENILVIAEIGNTIERNMCKFVLGEYFNEKKFYNYDYINNYIHNLKHSVAVQDSIRRLRELQKEIPWDQDLMGSLNFLKETRISIAHPELSIEKIDRAKDFLRKKRTLDGEDVKNINILKRLWKTSEDLLRTRSARRKYQNGPRTRASYQL